MVGKSSNCALSSGETVCGGAKMSDPLFASEGGKGVFPTFLNASRQEFGCNLEYKAKNKADTIAR
jgi:hypothetical protein